MEQRTGHVLNAVSPEFPCGSNADPHFVFDLASEKYERGVFYINLRENAALSMVLIVLEGLRAANKIRIKYQKTCLNGRTFEDPGGLVREVEMLKVD